MCFVHRIDDAILLRRCLKTIIQLPLEEHRFTGHSCVGKSTEVAEGDGKGWVGRGVVGGEPGDSNVFTYFLHREALHCFWINQLDPRHQQKEWQAMIQLSILVIPQNPWKFQDKRYDMETINTPTFGHKNVNNLKLRNKFPT